MFVDTGTLWANAPMVAETGATVGLTEKTKVSGDAVGASVPAAGTSVPRAGALMSDPEVEEREEREEGDTASAQKRSTVKAPRPSEWYPKVSSCPKAQMRMTESSAPVSKGSFPAVVGVIGRVKAREVVVDERSTTANEISWSAYSRMEGSMIDVGGWMTADFLDSCCRPIFGVGQGGGSRG